MARKFIAALALTSVIATGISTSAAKADPTNNFGDFLAATILLLAIGSALEGGVEVTNGAHNGRHVGPPAQDRWTSPPGHGPDRPDRWDKLRELPKICQQSFTTQHGLATIFEKSCLLNNYRNSRRLPESCEETLWTTVGVRQGYHPTCLRRQGYTVSRR